jgi:formate transporter
MTAWLGLRLAETLETCRSVPLAGVRSMSDGAVGETMVQIARSKIALDPVSAVARGILCNVLVWPAGWLVVHGRAECDR